MLGGKIVFLGTFEASGLGQSSLAQNGDGEPGGTVSFSDMVRRSFPSSGPPRSDPNAELQIESFLPSMRFPSTIFPFTTFH